MTGYQKLKIENKHLWEAYERLLLTAFGKGFKTEEEAKKFVRHQKYLIKAEIQEAYETEQKKD